MLEDELKWVLGAMGSIAAAFLVIWWKVEAKQDKKLDDLKEDNGDAHGILHMKIDKVQDKIEDIWKHMVKEKK